MNSSSLYRTPSALAILLVGPMPPTKGGITTFMLNLMASHLNEQLEFVSYTTTRPPKRDVIDNWGYGAVLRGGPVRIFHRNPLTVGRFIGSPRLVQRWIAAGLRIPQCVIAQSQFAYEYLRRALRFAPPALPFHRQHGGPASTEREKSSCCQAGFGMRT